MNDEIPITDIALMYFELSLKHQLAIKKINELTVEIEKLKKDKEE